MAQANAYGVVRNTRGSSVCDGATKNMSVVHKGCLGKARESLINALGCTKGALDCALIKARY